MVVVAAALGLLLMTVWRKGPYEGRTIQYEVEGDFGVAMNIVYTTGESGVALKDEPLPWSTSITGGSQPRFELTASVNGPGALTCRIKVDGVQAAQRRNPGSGWCHVEIR